MTQAIIAVLALLVGILLGFFIRAISANPEKALLEKQLSENAEVLAALQRQLAQAQSDSAARAGFEALSTEREKTIAQLRADSDGLRGQIDANALTDRTQAARISQLEAELNNERQNVAEKIALLETAKKALSDQFAALASDILDQKSRKFSEGTQTEIGNLLNPLRQQLNEFREKVERVQTDSTTGVTELKTLIGTLGSLNQALTQEAHNLATALRRDTKAQGNWGETILRNILDKSGLLEGTHYSFQQSFLGMSEDGEPGQRRQTDVLVNLPGGRHLIIDSKVSLNAYNDSVSAPDEKLRAEATRKHLSSVRNHFNELSSRNYQSLYGIQSPDFVVMFVPIEPAFMLAVQEDEALWFDAYERGVLLAGPTTVLFVVRIVENLWRQEQQAKNVQKVMDRGEKLYDKFVGFTEDLEAIGNKIGDAEKSYKEAMSKLTSGRENLVRQVELLRELGLKPKKRLKVKLLEEAGVDEPTLALAAEAEDEAIAGS